MKGIHGVSIVEVDNGHNFSKGSCTKCGMGQTVYANLKQKCRHLVDHYAIGYKLVDGYLRGGGDPDMVIISQKGLDDLIKKTGAGADEPLPSHSKKT